MSKQRTLDEIFVRVQKRKHPDSATDATSALLSPSESFDATHSKNCTQPDAPDDLAQIASEDPTTPPMLVVCDSPSSSSVIVP